MSDNFGSDFSRALQTRKSKIPAKTDLFHYYERCAKRFMPWIERRPLLIVRCPDSRNNQFFTIRHWNRSLPSSVRRLRWSDGVSGFSVDSTNGLLDLIDYGALEFRVGNSRREQLERCERLVFDLSKNTSSLLTLALAARALREELQRHGLPAFVQANAQRGLQIVSLTPSLPWNAAWSLAQAVSESCARRDRLLQAPTPEDKRKRGCISISYARNLRAEFSIAPYSTCALPGLPVAAPLSWNELPAAEQKIWHIPDVLRRLRRQDPWTLNSIVPLSKQRKI